MHSTWSEYTKTSHTISPSDVELLNEAVLYPVIQAGSVSVSSSSDLQCDSVSPPVGTGTFAICIKAIKGRTVQCVVKIPRFLDYDQFDRELTAMLQCNRHDHPGIVRLWGISTPPTGAVALPRLVMPLVEGLMLGRWLIGDTLEVRKAGVRVAVQLVEAVHHLHKVVGIIHGDLSMKNVLIDRKRKHHVTLIDLGSARPIEKGNSRRWVHGHYRFSPPEALSDWPCDLGLAETHVLGVLLICIERSNTEGMTSCPLPFQEGKDTEAVCAIARLVRFWGRSRLFPYWNAFRQKAGDRIETITGCSSSAVSGKVGLAGLRLADPIIHARRSLVETLRHLNER